MIKKLIIFILLFCLVIPQQAYGLAEWAVYVDTAATGNNDGGRDHASPNDPTEETNWTDAYTSLDGVDAHVPNGNQDLTTSDVWLHVYTRGGADTTTATLESFTTDATRYILIDGYDFPSDGILDTNKYHLYNNNATADTLLIQGATVKDVTINNLQVLVVEADATNRYGIRVAGVAATTTVKLSNSIVKGSCSGTGIGMGVLIDDADCVFRMWNTTVYGFFIAADSGFIGINLNNCSTAKLSNVTSYGNFIGIARSAGTVDASNCISGNNTDDWLGSINDADFCCDDDNQGNNNQSPSGGDWDNEMIDPGNGDFTLKVGGNCINNGEDDGMGDGYGATDIIGTTRTNWDIGAFEYTSSSVVPILYNLENN